MNVTSIIAGKNTMLELRVAKRMKMNACSIETKTSRIKTPSESETTMTEVVYPNNANPMGMLQGGKLIQWMDTASAICAQTHAEAIAVTALMDKAVFKKPAKVGDIVTVKAKLTRSFDTSMEIFVQAWTRSVKSPVNQLIGECYFTFVAIDANAKPCSVPTLAPQTDVECNSFIEALIRKQSRKAA